MSENTPIYGVILAKRFMICDRRNEPVDDPNAVYHVRTALKCNRDYLFDLLYVLGIRPPNPNDIPINIDILREYCGRRHLFSDDSLKTASLDRLQVYWSWCESGVSHHQICDLIQSHLEKIGQIHQ